MQINELKKFLDQFHNESLRLFPNVQLKWLTDTTGIDGLWLDRVDAPLKNRHGVYIFITRDSKVLYIGKAQADNQDICGRVWAHVKTPNKDRDATATRENIIIYPNNEWREHTAERSDQLIAGGRFLIWAAAIEPFHFAGLYEIAGLLFHKEKDGILPRYNKQLG